MIICILQLQKLSRPLLVLSLTTAFSDHSGSRDSPSDPTQDSPSDPTHDSPGISTSNAVSEPCSDLSVRQPINNMRYIDWSQNESIQAVIVLT